MYGLINQGLEDFVSSVGGDAVWQDVRRAAGLEAGMFVSVNPYPDALTYDLVVAASCALSMSTEQLLVAFGRHWIMYTARRGYGAIFDTMGRTLPEFLTNLDMMHTRLSLSMPDLRPPAFLCEPLEGGRIRIEYRSDREGLAPMVIGLLEGLAEMYGLDMSARQTLRRCSGQDHDEFLLEPVHALSLVGGVS